MIELESEHVEVVLEHALLVLELLGLGRLVLVDEVVLAQQRLALLDERLLGQRILVERLPQVGLGQTEEVRVAARLDVGRAPVARLVAGYVEYADLAEVAALLEVDEDGGAVVRDDAQLAALDEVHLAADVALAANEVAGAEDLELEPGDELLEQAGLAVLEDVHALERLQVHVDGYLGLQVLGQALLEYELLVHAVVDHPRVVEPVDDALLQRALHARHVHEALDEVDVLLELALLHVEVVDDLRDAAHDDGEHDHADHVAHDHVDLLERARRRLDVADGREHQGRAIEALGVLGDEVELGVEARLDQIAQVVVVLQVKVKSARILADEKLF